MITILAGGTGSIKVVRGLYKEYKNMTVISNVADNFWYYGLYICPDIDTIIYGLSNILDKKRGWGIKGDSFNFLKYMDIIKEESWFALGDKDLTTHILRTKMLKEGKNLSQITEFFAKKYNINIKIIPASNDHYETHIITKGNKEIHLQEYWIKNKGQIPVHDIIYSKIKETKANELAERTLLDSKLIIFAPGNPITSIGSIINIGSISKMIKNLKKKVVIISPIISNKVISGPTETYMKAKRIEPNINGLINFYAEFTNNMIFAIEDKTYIEREIAKKFSHIKFHYTKILLNNLKEERNLAKYIISNFYKK